MPKTYEVIPVRNLEEVSRINEQAIGRPVLKYELSDDYVSADRYSKAKRSQQAVADWTRNRDHIYINGVPLNEILNILRINFVRNSLTQFFSAEANLKVGEARSQAFHPFYAMAQLLAGKDVRNANYSIDDIASEGALAAFIDIYDEHHKIFDTLAKNNRQVEELNALMHNDCHLFFKDSSTSFDDFPTIWKKVLREYLFTGSSTQIQNAFIAMMESYAHQGGVMTPATFIVNEALGNVNFFDKTEFSVDSQEAYSEYSTLEFIYDLSKEQLVIRDKSPISKLYSSYDKAVAIEFAGHNIVEYDVTHLAAYAPHNQRVSLRITSALAYADANTWEFLNAKITMLSRLKTMLPHLKKYADNYLTKKHDATLANRIFNLFPELDQIRPRKALGFFTTPTQTEHNKFDKILAALGQLDVRYGVSIRNDLPKHLLFETSFINAMKLLLRLDDGRRTIEMLRRYVPANQDPATLYSEHTLKALHSRICRGYVSYLDFDKLLVGPADIFVNSSLLMNKIGLLDQLQKILANDVKKIGVNAKLLETENGLYEIYGKIAGAKVMAEQSSTLPAKVEVELDESKEAEQNEQSSSPALGK